MGKWIFKAWLKGSNEVPRVNTNATGLALLKFKHHNGQSRLFYAVKVRNIANVTNIHLHLGRKGHEGPIIATLFGPTRPGISVNQGVVRGVLRSSDLVGPLRGHSLLKLVKLFLLGKIYVNVHTTQHPDGEIRGQVKKLYKKGHCHSEM